MWHPGRVGTRFLGGAAAAPRRGAPRPLPSEGRREGGRAPHQRPRAPPSAAAASPSAPGRGKESFDVAGRGARRASPTPGPPPGRAGGAAPSAAGRDASWVPTEATRAADALSDARRLERLDRLSGREGMTVLLGKGPDYFEDLAAELGEPRYRGRQLYQGVVSGARDVSDVSTLPRAFRERLVARGVLIGRSEHEGEAASADGTLKLLRRLGDGLVVETVGIPGRASPAGGGGRGADAGAEVSGRGRDAATRASAPDADTDPSPGSLTVCVSSQVGCPMKCSFCATGRGGFSRSLTPAEIVDQVLAVRERFPGLRVSNVVFMGMGEPCLNLPSVLAAAKSFSRDLGIGARRITVSTVGVPGTIERLAREAADFQLGLAISLHAPDQATRERLVPAAKGYPLADLMRDASRFSRETRRRVSFEYTLLRDLNDTEDHAALLAGLLRFHIACSRLLPHVNLIPWNPTPGAPRNHAESSPEAIARFKARLEARAIPVSVRVTRGRDAAAACGQLANDKQVRGRRPEA